MNLRHAIMTMLDQYNHNIQGMNIMVVDKTTYKILKILYPYPNKKDNIFSIEKLYKSRKISEEFNAIFFISPEETTIKQLLNELQDPLYKNYYLIFTNEIYTDDVDALKNNDDFGVIKDIVFCYVNFYPLTSHLFSLDIDKCLGITDMDPKIINICRGLYSIITFLNERPIIRFQTNSCITQFVANEINRLCDNDEYLWNHKNISENVLLILDRNFDPITPLLHQWTLASMIHNLIGIKNNKIILNNKKIILCEDIDKFYQENMYKDFGVVSKKIIDNKKYNEEIKNHILIMNTISKMIDNEKLFKISYFEQELLCLEDNKSASIFLSHIMDVYDISQNKQILAMLYCLRYGIKNFSLIEKNKEILDYINIHKDIITKFQKYALSSINTFDPLENKNILKTTFKNIRRTFKPDNPYMEFKPQILKIVENLINGKLETTNFPFISKPKHSKLKTIIIFIIGGVTYAEECIVHQLSEKYNINIVIGGTNILNPHKFISELKKI